jgi:DNA-binding CsgD family transcriptional regulator
MTDPSSPADLSEREIEILKMVATGASNKEIAQSLHISANTVKVHLRNVFAKIDVSSRTEATMWAVRQGFVQPFAEGEKPGEPVAERRAESHPSARRWLWVLAAFAITLLLVLLVWQFSQPGAAGGQPTATTEVLAPAIVSNRWQELRAMPTGRASLAAVNLEGRIYTIGGETPAGVSNVLEIYNPGTDSWTAGAPKPTAVSAIQAAVIGGKIFVPGGELPDGRMTDVLEIYDPREDAWTTGARLPQPLSAYALVAYEGRLYLFGGWDGERFRREVYTYLPGADGQDGEWVEKSPLPEARGYAAAAVSAGRIYVLGGQNNSGTLLIENDIYAPAQDLDGQSSPWQGGMPLPEGRYRHSIANAGDLLFVIGGTDEAGQVLPNLQFSAAASLWQRTAPPIPESWTDLAVASISTQLFTFGGRAGEQIQGTTRSYQALFSIAVPIAP